MSVAFFFFFVNAHSRILLTKLQREPLEAFFNHSNRGFTRLSQNQLFLQKRQGSLTSVTRTAHKYYIGRLGLTHNTLFYIYKKNNICIYLTEMKQNT